MVRSLARCIAGLALASLACGSPTPLAAGLAEYRAPLRDHFGHRLAQMHPYVWAEDGVLWLLACRWPTGSDLGVALVGGRRREAKALETARAAWGREALGVRLQSAEPAAAEIRIELVDAVAAADGSAGAGSSAVDCALGADGPASARLVRAEIQIAREAPPEESPEPRDPRLLSDAERVGVFVHELGHALGYQGHAVTGTVMARGRAGAREAGGRALRGLALEDSTLSALYALPEGAVLARSEIAAVRTAELDRLGALARESAWHGPFLRVGDRTARIFWRDGSDVERGFVLVNLEETLRRPGRALFVAEADARAALDPAPGEKR